MSIAVDDVLDVRRRAMDLLARREHSRLELQRKLLLRGYSPDIIETVLNRLVQDNLLSDARFTEAYVNMRKKMGFGPMRLREELRERGVCATLIERELEAIQHEWPAIVARVRYKRFGPELPTDFPSRAKQARFLHYRGFSQNLLDYALENEVLV